MKPEYCPECRSTNLKSVDLRGEVVCTDCGLVIEDSNFEKNPFVAIGIKNRATLPYLANASSKAEHGRIVKNPWLYTTNQKNTEKGLNNIDVISEKLNLPKVVISEAKLIFKELMSKNYSWGRGLVYLSYSCVYLACNIFNLPKTSSEIGLYSGLSKRNIMRYARNISKKFKIQVSNIDPLDLLPRFASNLDLSQSTLSVATQLVMKIKEDGLLRGRRPETISAVALFVASKNNNEYRTQRDIANNTGVVETTIRTNAKLIQP